MKKFLSLVLALVMTMSLVTVSAGAADYADADSITYVEAVDVLSELGILQGDANGFRPADTLKRSEAAKIICALNLTPDVASELSADTAPFADVAASHWAAGYIAEGVQSGIIAGVGGNLFAPDAELTGYAYLKMLLVSLGYDASAEGMTGANWSINVAKLAKKVGLTKGNDKFVGTKAVTREEAALYALNALQAELVEYEESGSSIQIGDIVITNNKGDAEGTDVKFMEENYKKLTKKTSGEDALGRPATEWKYDGEKIGTYADTADYVVVLEKDVDDLAKYLDKEEILEDADCTGAEYNYNGVKKLTAGSVLEIFADEEEVETVVVINYVLGEVTKVSEKLTKAEKKDGATAKVTVEFGEEKIVVLDNEFAGFNYEKGDMILFINDGNEVLASELAEVVEGEVTATKSGNKVKIDGEWYVDLTKSLEEEDEATCYLNAAGQIMACEAIEGEESEDYAYIYNAKTLKDEENEDGETIEGAVKVWAVLADGSKETFIVSEDTDVKGLDAEGKVVTYTVEDDEIIIEKAYATEKASISKDTKKVDGAFLKSSTEFVFVEYDADDKVWETETVTGYKNVKVADEAVYVVANDDDEATLIFVIAGNGKVTADDTEYAVMLEDGYVERTKNDDGDYEYTYAVYTDGEETEVVFDAKLSAKAGDVVSFVYDSDEVATKADVLKVTGTVESANDEYYYVAGEDYEYGDEEIITITEVYDEDGEFDCIEVSEGGEIAEDAEVIMIFDDDEVVLVYVYEIDE